MGDKVNNEKKKFDSTEVVFILDRSGSMGGLEKETIKGFNSLLKKQKEDGGEVLWSTILFNDEYEVLHDRIPIEKMKRISEREYFVKGCTALLDAVGRTIVHIRDLHKKEGDKAPVKTLFVITTDGMENASHEYTYRGIKQMIKRQQEKSDWEFIFLGANIDAVGEAAKIGIRSSRAARFINDEKGIQKNYFTLTSAITLYRYPGRRLEESALDDIKEDFDERGR